MKTRIAFLAEAEDIDSFSASETRVLLGAIARHPETVALWFAVDSLEAPHFWNGIRVFPIPSECLDSASFLHVMMGQQRPNVVLSNVARSRFKAGLEYLENQEVPWVHRMHPEDNGSEWKPRARLILTGNQTDQRNLANGVLLPYLQGLSASTRDGADPTVVVQKLGNILLKNQALEILGHGNHLPHLVMRQQLFCNTSLAQVMFELTSALIELGVPTIPQEEHSFFSKSFIHREADLYRKGAPKKYERICGSLGQPYDPENAITIHFGLFKSGRRYARHAVFPSLAGREILYTTGNHTVSAEDVRQLMDSFEMILAPSQHVLRPYLDAGLPTRSGAVLPHGIDPAIYSPESVPFPYPTGKRFKFLQTSFPWIYEKGFDLTIKAFTRAFSNHDDVALILRVPKLQQLQERSATFCKLEELVKEVCDKPAAPEILLLEQDVELHRRGGIYTGADCYVHPLRAEGFGMTILEAMACGLPVIATSWSGPADFLSPAYSYGLRHSSPVGERNRNGAILRYHVEPDLDHLIYLMQYIYQHHDEAKALGEKASAVAHRDWTWKNAAADLAALFHLT